MHKTSNYVSLVYNLQANWALWNLRHLKNTSSFPIPFPSFLFSFPSFLFSFSSFLFPSVMHSDEIGFAKICSYLRLLLYFVHRRSQKDLRSQNALKQIKYYKNVVINKNVKHEKSLHKPQWSGMPKGRGCFTKVIAQRILTKNSNSFTVNKKLEGSPMFTFVSP